MKLSLSWSWLYAEQLWYCPISHWILRLELPFVVAHRGLETLLDTKTLRFWSERDLKGAKVVIFSRLIMADYASGNRSADVPVLTPSPLAQKSKQIGQWRVRTWSDSTRKCSVEPYQSLFEALNGSVGLELGQVARNFDTFPPHSLSLNVILSYPQSFCIQFGILWGKEKRVGC